MSAKNLTLAIVFSFFVLVGILVYQYAKFNDGKVHIVFCDVGQGDAIFLRTPKGADILVDGGPNESVLACLSGHMPFWDRDLELVILTHPHADHLNGLISVVKRYKIGSFATENLKNNTTAFKALMDELKNQNIKRQYLYAGDRFVFKDGVSLNIVGPTRQFLKYSSPTGMIGETSEFASIESLFRYRDFSILLTGDSQAAELKEALQSHVPDGTWQSRVWLKKMGSKNISVLQVSHHGSKTGLDFEILDSLKPELAVISVGENNRYGHPAKEIIKILSDKDIRILRTDEVGEVEIVTDGTGWGVKN